VSRDLVAALLDQWEEAADRGEDISPEQLCRNNPEVLAIVREQITKLRAINQALRPAREIPAAHPSTACQEFECAGAQPLEGVGRTDVIDQSASSARLLGDYELLEEIGRGGMGIVFQARQQSTDRLVALKVIRPDRLTAFDRAERERVVERFRTEAQAAARLEHDHIVTIYEVGEVEDCHYYSMRLVRGQSLAVLLANGPLSGNVAARYLEPVCRAVHQAHESGILHRDLKPQNILIDQATDRALVADFGLAKLVDGERQLTEVGEVFGSPSYMSPEQARNATLVDATSDVYSLGAVLYECLTGRPPFQAESTWATLRQAIENEPVAPRILNPDADRDLETITLKCLDKVPDRRYPSAVTLAEELARYRRGDPIQARPINRLQRTWKWCRRNPASAALFIVIFVTSLLVVGGTIWYQSRLEAAGQVAAIHRYLSLVYEIRAARSAPRPGWTWLSSERIEDASRFLPATLRDDQVLRTELANTQTAFDLRPRGRIELEFVPHGLAFDPTGRRIAVTELKNWIQCRVELIDVHTHTTQSLSFATGPTPDSVSAFFQSLGNELLKQDGARGVAFSPDGQNLVVGTRSGWLHCWDLRDEEPRPRTWRAHQSEITGIVFTPSGEKLFTSSKDGTVACWTTSKPGEESVPRFTARAAETPPQELHIALGHDGTYLVCGGKPGVLRLLDEKTLKVLTSVKMPASKGDVVLSSNPRLPMVAANRASAIGLADVARNGVLATLEDPDLERGAHEWLRSFSFSPDGALLVSCGNTSLKLWEVGSGRVLARIPLPNTEKIEVAWGAGGSVLAALDGRGIALFELRNGQSLLSQGMGMGPVRGFQFSPDGNSLATLHGTKNHDETDFYLHRGENLDRVVPLALKKTGISHGDEPVTISWEDDERCWVSHRDFSPIHVDWQSPDRIQRGNPATAHALCMSPERTKLWGIFRENQVSIWDWPAGKQTILSPDPHFSRAMLGKARLTCLDLGRQFCAVGASFGMVQLFGLDGTPQAVWHDTAGEIMDVAFSADETFLACGLEDGNLCLFSTSELRLIDKHDLFAGSVQSVACHPREPLVAAAGIDRRIRLFRASKTGLSEYASLECPTGIPRSLQFSSTGESLSWFVRGEWGVRCWNIEGFLRECRRLGIAH
jgi:eukaryotic-like serine/threonine-protein kinase